MRKSIKVYWKKIQDIEEDPNIGHDFDFGLRSDIDLDNLRSKMESGTPLPYKYVVHSGFSSDSRLFRTHGHSYRQSIDHRILIALCLLKA